MNSLRCLMTALVAVVSGCAPVHRVVGTEHFPMTKGQDKRAAEWERVAPGQLTPEGCEFWKNKARAAPGSSGRYRDALKNWAVARADEECTAVATVEAEERERAEKAEEEMAEWSRRRQAEKAKREAERREEITEREVGTMQCDQERFAKLQQAVTWNSSMLKSDGAVLVSHEVLVLGEEPDVLDLKLRVPRKHWVFALAFERVELGIVTSGGQAITQHSFREHHVRYSGVPESDSRAFIPEGSEVYTASVSGSGCALLMIYRVYR